MKPVIGTGKACFTISQVVADFEIGYAAILQMAPEDRPTVWEGLPEIKQWAQFRRAMPDQGRKAA